MELLLTKSLHIIFVVSWFAGLFYLPRLFVYFAEAQEKEPSEQHILQRQFLLMQKRLWTIIMQPAMVITVVTGLHLTYLYDFFAQGWLQLKLFLVFLLLGYHIVCGKIISINEKVLQQQKPLPYTSMHMRMWNEVATLLLFAIVFLVVFKNSMSVVWGIGGVVVLGMLLMLMIKWYKKIRERQKVG